MPCQSHIHTLMGKSKKDRDFVVEHAGSGALSIIEKDWKYIEPHPGARVDAHTKIELGNEPQPQLYHLKKDLAEQENLAEKNPERTAKLAVQLKKVKEAQRTRP